MDLKPTMYILGLQSFHFKVIAITLVISFIIFMVMICSRYGVFKDVEFVTQKLPRSRIIYVNHRGAYENIGNAFERVKEDSARHFKISNCFGIFYDDPSQMQDKNLCRSTIGIMVNEGETRKIEMFMNENIHYKTASIAPTKCISVTHPFVNLLSFFLIIRKVYPKLIQYIKNKQLETAPCMVQVYHFVSPSAKTVQILAPLENFSDFMLWEDTNQPLAMKKRI